MGSKGSFESLHTKLFDKSWKDRGLLIYIEKVRKTIRASMGKGMTDVQKFHDMCTY
jgi:hypothetical protein